MKKRPVPRSALRANMIDPTARLSHANISDKHEIFRNDDAFFKQLLESLEDYAIFTTDKNGIISSWNQGAKKIFGYSEREIIGKPTKLFFTNSDIKKNIPHKELVRALRAGKSIEEGWRIKKGGKSFWASGIIFPLKDEKGNTQGFTKIVRDLTESREAEIERDKLLDDAHNAHLETEAERKRLHNLFMQAPALIAILSGPENTIELFNPLFRKLFGNRNVDGKPIREALPELAGQGYFELIDRVYKTGRPFIGNEYPQKIDRKNNGVLEDGFFNFVYQAARDSNNKIDSVFIHAVDVTEQVRSRHALQASRERLKLAQKAGNIGTFEWHISDNKIIWTPELESLYGIPPGTFKGTFEDWLEHIHKDDRKKFESKLFELINNGVGYDTEFRALLPDGQERWLYAKGDVFHDKNGKAIRVIGVNIDITDRKKIEQEKDRFISIASHELKTPVTSIKLFSEILQKNVEKLGDQSLTDSARMITTQVNRMMSLLNDLLDISRIQSKRLDMVKDSFFMDSLVEDIVRERQSSITSHTIKLTLNYGKKIVADKARINQVVTNLISNAIKYSPQSNKIIVKTSAYKDGVVVSIQDFGIGISKNDQLKIFQQFFRAQDAQQRHIPGFGLGLHISSEIVKAHGGKMWIKSAENKGTIFYFYLPQKTK